MRSTTSRNLTYGTESMKTTDHMHEYGVRREVETVAGFRGSSSVCMRRSESRVSGFSSHLIGGARCARSSLLFFLFKNGHFQGC